MQLPGPMGWYVDRDSATLAIAVLALVLPGLRWLYDRFFRKGKISFYKIDKIAINFAWQGLVLNLNGTYRAMNEPLFVESIAASVVRQRDSSQHAFEWRLVRFPTFGSTGTNWNFGTAGGYLVTPAQPIRYDLLFYDPATEKTFEPLKAEIQEKWSAHVDAALEAASTPMLVAAPLSVVPPSPTEHAAPTEAVAQAPDEETVFEEFYESEDVRRIRVDIDRACYWEAGRYSLTMNIKTAEPNRSFIYRWTFELSEDDARKLRDNTQAIVRSWCGVQLPFGAEHLARVDYLTA